MADDQLDFQPEEASAASERPLPRRRAAHFAVPPEEDRPSAPAASAAHPSSDDDIEAVAQAYAASAASQPAVPEPAASLPVPAPDEDLPVFSAEPSPFVPDPNASPLQPAVPLANPQADLLSTAPGDTIPRSLDELPERINTEGPILRTEEVYVIPEAPAEPQQDELGASGPFKPVKINATTSQETGAPRPIGVDPASTGAFSMLTAGEGAVLTTRDTASSAKDAALSSLSDGDHNRRSDSLRAGTSRQVASSQSARARRTSSAKRGPIVAIVAVAIVLGVVGFVFASRFLQRAPEVPAESEAPAQEQVVAVGESVDFGGYGYSLQQDQMDVWCIVRASGADADGSAIATLPGTPLSLVLCEGALYVPENLGDGWDVVALMIADGSEPTQLTTADGIVFGGQGAAETATLEGTSLTVTDASGSAYTTDLAA